MLEYAMWARRLDDAAGPHLAPFCARRCPTPPVGCCHHLGYDMGLVPDGMLRLQALEATWGGWTLPADADRHRCRYHTPTGCALRLFKTPACLQYLCPPLAAALERAHGTRAARDLVEALDALGRCDIDRARVFARLADAVRAGRRLASIGAGDRPADDPAP
jgi:hypothetical protein